MKNPDSLPDLWEIIVPKIVDESNPDILDGRARFNRHLDYIRTTFPGLRIDESRTGWLCGIIVVSAEGYSESEVGQFLEAIFAKGWDVIPYIPSSGEPERNTYQRPDYPFGAIDPKELDS